ncbi:hypothetical protein AMAG_02187 [Allomyces macrogynus ATCC 38327]|uniref:Chitin synthase n=1 Tax=Allomyces macrogynus (strain ATCC 38327) TaxID=578462 RepID=A0A0L0S1V0_ALLM3|nr:hypothetical protein AMAG_02187 [Allomyces macrogynus ATCC 38327]|eukprot:KNE56376.1 hypothetical protein AMAG_02187 [Allomyces macrogynus ATCC 38327]
MPRVRLHPCLRRALVPVLAALLGTVCGLILFRLYPEFCRQSLYNSRHVCSNNLVSVHGYVADLSRATSPRLQTVHAKYAGRDISPLVPRWLILAHRPEADTLVDGDLAECVSDTLVADAWLALHLDRINNTNVIVGADGRLVKCAAPLPVNCTASNNTSSTATTSIPAPAPTNDKSKPTSKTGDWDACINDATDLAELMSLVVGEALITSDVYQHPSTGTVERNGQIRKLDNLLHINGLVLNVTTYLRHALLSRAQSTSANESLIRSGDTAYLPDPVNQWIMDVRTTKDRAMVDHAETLLAERAKDQDQLDKWKRCLVKLFYVGKLSSVMYRQCWSRNWLLLVVLGGSALVFTVKVLFAAITVLRRSGPGHGVIRIVDVVFCCAWSRRRHGRLQKQKQARSAAHTSVDGGPAKLGKFSVTVTADPSASPRTLPVTDASIGDDDEAHRAEHRRGPVLFLVPLFAEPVTVIQRTLSSIVQSEARHKALLVICDGNVQPVGEIKDTYRAVLDHLRYRPPPRLALAAAASGAPLALGHVDGASVTFQYMSTGEGAKQWNVARLFSGYCTDENGATVPYVVLVKIGHPAERAAGTPLPGNRGKRDSLLMALRFLQFAATRPAHCDATAAAAMTDFDGNDAGAPPAFSLAQAIYLAFAATGLDPRQIEFLCSVDGDTAVQRTAPRILTEYLTRNRDVAAACGSLIPDNAFTSLWSMCAAYRLYVTTHLRLAWQQWTRLTILNPGFAMYRVQTVLPPPPVPDAVDTASTGGRRAGSPAESLRQIYNNDAPNLDVIDLADADAPRAHSFDRRSLGSSINSVSPLRASGSSAAAISITTQSPLVVAHDLVVARLGHPTLTTAFERNLYFLGEDLVLGTLLQLAHPQLRLAYVPRARAWTKVPTSLLHTFQWLRRGWLAHVFVTLDALWAPIVPGARKKPCPIRQRMQRKRALGEEKAAAEAVAVDAMPPTSSEEIEPLTVSERLVRFLSRTTSFFSLVMALLMPSIYAYGIVLIWSAIKWKPLFVLCSIQAWGVAAGVHVLTLIVTGRWDVVAQLMAYLTAGLPLVLVASPVFAMFSVTRPRWSDQWCAQGADVCMRVPGAMADASVDDVAVAMAISPPTSGTGKRMTMIVPAPVMTRRDSVSTFADTDGGIDLAAAVSPPDLLASPAARALDTPPPSLPTDRAPLHAVAMPADFPAQWADEDLPETVLGMRTSMFRTRAAAAVARVAGRLATHPQCVVLAAYAYWDEAAAAPADLINDDRVAAATRWFVDEVTRQLAREVGDKVVLLDYLVEWEVRLYWAAHAETHSSLADEGPGGSQVECGRGA